MESAKPRAKAQGFEDLIVWQKSHRFVLDIYKYTERFPKTEIYGLSSQLRRAAISIPANICEGFKKSGPWDKVRFMNIAQGSLEECRYYLILSRDLDYGFQQELMDNLDEIGRLLHAYSSAIKNRNSGS